MRFGEESRAFIRFLEEWTDGLKPLVLKREVTSPQETAIISVDMINGFCHEGPLASPRVKGIIPDIVGLFKEGSKKIGIHIRFEPSCVMIDKN